MKKILSLFCPSLIIAVTLMLGCKQLTTDLPVINSFEANPPGISAGASSTLTWNVSGATAVSIDQGIGNVALTGSRIVTPEKTTTYVLTATNKAGSITATTRIVVSGTSPSTTQPPSSSLPVISSFIANPPSISAGSSTTLSWNVSNATSVTIEPGIGTVDSSGSISVSPASSTTYILMAINGSGKKVATAQVTVSSEAYTPPPATAAFAVSGVTAGVEPVNFTGSCPKTFSCSAIITVNGPGTVTYRWERSDGLASSTQTAVFAAAGSQMVTTGWPRESSGSYWVRVRTLSPNEVVSNQANFTLNCSTPFAVTSVQVDIGPLPPQPVTCPYSPVLTVTIATNGPGNVTYRWERSDGGSSPVQTMSFGSAGTQSATTGWPLNADGTYWVRVRTLTPNEVISNTRTWTIDCK